MVAVYVPKVAEFSTMIDVSRDQVGVRVINFSEDYHKIESDGDLIFNRKELKMKPAVWYGLFTGGLDGNISHFGRDELRVIGSNAKA